MCSQATNKLLVYGANGYTARLLLPCLKKLGVEVIAAGRNGPAIRELSDENGLDYRVFDLADPRRLDDSLYGVQVLLNAAGPFLKTGAPLIDACLRQRIDYLDLSGELEPLSYAASCDEIARRVGVMLLPAIGFDVVPSDCLALYLRDLVPNADRLTLSISASNLLSRGSAATFVEHAGSWVQVRRAGRLEPMRFRTQTRWTNFGDGDRPTIAVSWGDLVTAFHSTRIPNIEVYFEATAFRWFAVTANQLWGWALRDPAIKSSLMELTRVLPRGPNELERHRERSVIVGEVSNAERRVRARLFAPEAYTFTAEVAALVAKAVLGGQRAPGFQTPARLFGADFVLRLPGVTRERLQ